ncbi:MAG: serine/threonine protein kinase [Myxococcota bacterium]|nr:serine/threonine protein kinase [Myxococcota bacterium]
MPPLENFGPYLLLGKLADGGMAHLHHAVHRERPERVLALKRILPKHAEDPEFRRFFALERGLSCALSHPNVVQAVDEGTVDGTPYLAMEYIHGRALSRILALARQLNRRLPLPHGVALGVQALEGLDYIHHARTGDGTELGAVLCDLSPSNMMVGYDGVLKLIDFGIASSRFKYIEQLGMLRGKKNYLAPEQLRGQPLDLRADLYAAAVCLVEILTSQPLFQHKSEFEMEEALRTGQLPSFTERIPDFPPALAEVIARALSLRPEERYASAAEFAQALRPFTLTARGGPVGPAQIAQAIQPFVSAARREDDAHLARIAQEARAALDPSG